MSYDKNDMTYHIINVVDITYLCLANSSYKLELAHRFLTEVKEKFTY